MHTASVPKPTIQINIRCPTMGRLIWTGVEMGRSEAEKATFKETARCSACGKSHAWTGKDIVYPFKMVKQRH